METFYIKKIHGSNLSNPPNYCDSIFLNNVTPIKCLSAIGLKFFYRKKLTYISRLYIWISLALMQKHKLLSSKPSEPTFRNYIIPILAKLLEV